MNLVCLQRIYPSSVGEEEQSVVGVHNHQVQHGIVFSSTHADDTLATAVLSAEGIGRHPFHVALLAEGDDQNDPIADAARAILDGHIVLSRRLAESGHYPAIDIEASISRAMNDITSREHQESARAFKQLYSLYRQNQDLINVGAYESGSDERIDAAIQAIPELERFLRQDMNTPVSQESSLSELEELFF